MDRGRVVNSGLDPALGEVSLQIVAPAGLDDEEVIHVSRGWGGFLKGDVADALELWFVRLGMKNARLVSGWEVAQLEAGGNRLQSVQSRVHLFYDVVVLAPLSIVSEPANLLDKD